MANPGNSSYAGLRNGEMVPLSEREAKKISDALQGGDPPEYLVVRQKWGQNDVGTHLIRSDAVVHLLHIGNAPQRKAAKRKDSSK